MHRDKGSYEQARSAEQQVKAAWVNPHCCHNSGGAKTWCVIDFGPPGTRLLVTGIRTRKLAWQAALEYTLELQEEIGQVEEEIAVIQRIVDSFMTHGGDTFRRTLARLQAIKEELTRGMKRSSNVE